MSRPEFYPDLKTEFLATLEALRGKKVAVIGHMRPDGDCIGSIVGLVRVLNTMDYGIEAIGVNRDLTPKVLQNFVGDTPFHLYGEVDLNGYEAIAVDCADERRMSGKLRDSFDTILMNVDHHISNPAYATHNFVVPHASATAEILAGLFLDLDLEIDAVAAQALYVGIVTDTGQFRFASTTPTTFEIACQLCGKGAEPAKAAFDLYENESFNKLGLLQHFLASLELHFGDRVCLGTLLKSDFEATGAHSDETEGLVDYARAIEGVEIGVLIEERHDGFKASLRAKEPVYAVHEIAQQFNGGGHACAAGLNVNMAYDDFRTALLSAIDTHLANLNLTPVS